MPLKWLPKIVSGYGTFVLTLSSKLWEPSEGVADGDEDVSAAGAVVGYWVRYDYACKVILRIKDTELFGFMNHLEYLMKNKDTPFEFHFDDNDITWTYFVYLESPKIGERFTPVRDPSAPWVWELTLVLRSSDGTRILPPIGL